MSFDLISPNGGVLEFEPGLPEDYTGPILRGAISQFTKTNFAELIVQELIGDQYAIRLCVGKFFDNVSAAGNIVKQGLYSYFMLKNGVRKEIPSLGKLHVRHDMYTCFFTESITAKAKFEKNIDYSMLDIFYSPTLLEEFLPFFPELTNVLSASPSMILPGRICRILPAMKETINQLLNCQYDKATVQFYFDIKIRELLYQKLENAYKKTTKEYYFKSWEIAKIHDAATLLEEFIPKKPPSIRFLSRQVGLNAFKLKAGFRQYFSSGIFEWLMEKKMQYAKELLLTTNKPIKEICCMVGYPRTTNFITAFRRRFGMTPGSLRRQ